MLFSKLIFSIAYYKRRRIATKVDSARRREEKAKMNGQVIRKKIQYSENLPDEVIEVQPLAEENTKTMMMTSRVIIIFLSIINFIISNIVL